MQKSCWRGTENRAQSAAGTLRDSMREAIEDAIARFSGATDEIRQSAAEIKRELDDTRSELKRGAFDLPEETRESAARHAPRRVRPDQGAAGAIADRQPVEPAGRGQPAGAARRGGPHEQPLLRSPRRGVTPHRRLRPALRLRSSARPCAARSSRPAQPPQRATAGSATCCVAHRREEQAPARAAAAPRTPERNPRHVVESLNSLSVDIARAIDHDASVDLWRRYQRGERDVFTRRLYTLKGQQTFEEIKSKYGREPEFRAAVDRYIADFEKLLSDVARNDRDNMMTQTYLTSDTGKVYTMLAHASGRFGPEGR